MKRFTTQKLINLVCEDNESIIDAIDTSDSILNQDNREVPFITDDFTTFEKKTLKQDWLLKTEHAITVLCQIKKIDYELISFKKKQLNDIIDEDPPF